MRILCVYGTVASPPSTITEGWGWSTSGQSNVDTRTLWREPGLSTTCCLWLSFVGCLHKYFIFVIASRHWETVSGVDHNSRPVASVCFQNSVNKPSRTFFGRVMAKCFCNWIFSKQGILTPSSKELANIDGILEDRLLEWNGNKFDGVS